LLALSNETQLRLDALFAGAERDSAAELLVERCGTNLPFCGGLDSRSLERIRFAALKLSGGDLMKLRQAVEIAEVDWRDVLVAAGFANHINAHESWFPHSTKL
jgi:hypothetical protein